MKTFSQSVVVLMILALTACNVEENKSGSKQEIAGITSSKKIDSLLPYYLFIRNKKAIYSLVKSQQPPDSLQKFVFKTIAYEMPDYWIGTKWDFNGITRTPQNGEIACGYFINTLLEDVGYKISRVKLSMEPSSYMINQLCENVKRFSDISNLTSYINNFKGNQLFIIGLDFHTGFVIKQDSGIFFFHSNYIQRQGVVKEPLSQSRAIRNSKSFMIGRVK